MVTFAPTASTAPATSIPGTCGSATGKGFLEIPTADAGVDRIERRGRDVDPHLFGPGDRPFDILVAQDVGIAVLVKPHRFHESLVSLIVSCFEFEAWGTLH